MNDLMNRIAINIPTYKRPKMLEKLIRSIINCHINKELISDVYIIVVDNDINKSGRNIISEYAKRFNNTHKILYYNYPVKGLSNVRNELLRKSFQVNPDFIVFIDDDEYVTAHWLNELVYTIVNNKADAARGPVFAELTSPVSKSISRFFKRENYANNRKIKTWTAGNLIIRTSSLKKFDVHFDKRFNKTGSEDSYFGIQMAKKGASIFWAEHAVAFETIPKNRAKIKWLINRTYRVANTFMYMLKLEKKYLLVLKKLIISFIYIFIGSVSFIFLLIPIKIKYWGLLKFSEGVGGLAGLFNIRYREYK